MGCRLVDGFSPRSAMFLGGNHMSGFCRLLGTLPLSGNRCWRSLGVRTAAPGTFGGFLHELLRQLVDICLRGQPCSAEKDALWVFCHFLAISLGVRTAASRIFGGV